MDNIPRIANQLNVSIEQVSATVQLLDAENTVPFIARYRKEATGGLDEEQIRKLSELLKKFRALDERRESVIKSIESQDKLTPELHRQLLEAETLANLEDLYQPYKPKRRTRASIARERGLQGLADMILQQIHTEQSLVQLAEPYIKGDILNAEDAWAGARDIVAETISDHAEVRRLTREKALVWGKVRCEKIEGSEDLRSVYKIYYEFEMGVDSIRPHQVLAINRGEAEKVLRVIVAVSERDWRRTIASVFNPDPRSPLCQQLELAIRDSAERLLLPAIERDVRRELSERAERHAIGVFSTNLRALLSQPPLANYIVMGIDPGFRTGCKVAIVNPTGKVLDIATIYPHEPQKRWDEAIKIIEILISKHGVTLVAIGNGTASRETEQFVVELIRDSGVKYLIVNEAGASVYSASPLARSELPDLDVSMRGAVSIARRVQDPLAELVKIEPKSIGVGLYQHDVNQKQLTETLAGVVESVVNAVGVDLNTASPALLTYVSGIGPKLAERIVAYRDLNGPFLNRTKLLNIGGVGPKVFEQAAGFLRIREGDNPLDTSAIHPESYTIVEALLLRAGLTPYSSPSQRATNLSILVESESIETLAADLGTGIPTLNDIVEQLLQPGRDPRQDTPTPILRSDILSMEDLTTGMRLKGTVRNVVDFGAFIDIGVKQDGLLHRSQIPRGVLLEVGDIIDVEILNIETERGRIGLGWPGGG